MRTSAALLGFVVLTAACADGPESPLAPSADVGASDETVASAVFPLFPVPGSGSRAFGTMGVVAGVNVPPNPCDPRAPQVEAAAVGFCAVIAKPAREAIQAGSITLRDPASGAALVLPFSVNAPPSPCLVLRIVGTLAQGSWVPPGPADVLVSFRTSAGRIIGAARLQPVSPTFESNPGPPGCTVGIVPEPSYTVVAFALRPEDGSESQAFGRMWAAVGLETPPNPCVDDPVRIEGPGLAFCALIANPGLETLQSGTITLEGATRDESRVIPIRFSAPPSPCLALRVAGTLGLGTWTNPGPPQVQVSFQTTAGSIGGATGVSPGPPTVENVPGPPTVCTVTATSE